MTHVSDQEYAAAIQRERAAALASQETNRASMLALQESIDAGREVLRLGALRRDLAELLLDDMTNLTTARPWTIQRLAKHSYRPAAEVKAALDKLTAEGKLRQIGKSWEAA